MKLVTRWNKSDGCLLSHVLVTGATGFVGAHVVDLLLERGIKVTGTARSQFKASAMKARREKYGDFFSMAITGELSAPGVFDTLVQDVDVVIHVASVSLLSSRLAFDNPATYAELFKPVPSGTGTSDFEQDILIPAIKGTRSILKSLEKSPSVKRVVLTSSFAAIFDKSRNPNEPYTYTSENWNPITYEEAVLATDHVTAYRASKKLAELEAWNWVRSPSSVNANGDKIDLTVFCPPMVYGPWVHPLESLSSINASLQAHRNMVLGITSKPPGTTAWVDVRDVALAHVEAVYIQQKTSNKRFIVCSPEKSSFQQEAKMIKEAFPEWGERITVPPSGPLPQSQTIVDGSPLTRELGIEYRSSRDCFVVLAGQIHDQGVKEGLLVS